MIVYLFTPNTFEFVNQYVCQESPLELGVYIIPEHSTDIEPPSFDSEISTCKWTGSKWMLATIPVIEPKPDPTCFIAPPSIEELQISLTTIQAQITALSSTIK